MNEIVNLGNGQFVKVVMLKGEAGSSIQNIAKTSTSGLVDTYTITLTDGSTKTFTVTNGKSISSIEKTSTSGLVDTYKITFNDNTSQTFTVTNGNGIVSIEKTSTVGLVDTYTITLNSGSPVTFTVTNGADGSDGVGITSITKTGTSGLVDTYTITFTDGTSTTFDVTNGANGQDVGQSNLAPVETGNTASQSYAVGSHLIWNGIYYVVTQAIASGGSLNVGVNIQQDTVSNEIETLMPLKNLYSFPQGELITLSSTNKRSPIQVVGKYYDGRDIYRVLLQFNGSLTASTNSYVQDSFQILDTAQYIRILNYSGNYQISDFSQRFGFNGCEQFGNIFLNFETSNNQSKYISLTMVNKSSSTSRSLYKMLAVVDFIFASSNNTVD